MKGYKSIRSKKRIISKNNKSKTNSRNTKQYSAAALLIFALLFSFIPPSIMYSINQRRLGSKKRAAIYMATSLFIGGILIWILILLPRPEVRGAALGINAVVGLFLFVSQKKIEDLGNLKAEGKASLVGPLIICILATGAVVFLIVFGSRIAKEVPETSLKYNEDVLYYTQNVNDKEAENLIQYLIDTEFFMKDSNVASVKIDKEKEVYQFSMIGKKEFLNDEEMINFMKEFSQDISKQVFGGKPVEIHITDNYFNTLRVIK